MANAGTEVPTAPQFQVQNSFDSSQMQQMQQMSAMMAMAAAGMAGGIGTGLDPSVPGGMLAGIPPNMNMVNTTSGAPTFMPPMPPALGTGIPDNANSAPPPFPGMDFQAYASMFTQALQQAQQAYACGVDPSIASGAGATPSSFQPIAPYVPSMPPVVPMISVSVEGMKFQYQLTEDDLHKVFSRYGAVTGIKVDEASTAAQITFDSFPHAEAAMNDLNGKVLNGLEGTLRIVWTDQGASAIPPPTYPMMPPFTGWGFPPPLGNTSWPATNGVPQMNPGGVASPGMVDTAPVPLALQQTGPPPADQQLVTTPRGNNDHFNDVSPDDIKAPAHVKGVRKYTCRFLIGIDNDKDFQVVRRIIGAKGANMKRIVKQTEAKLRLRGAGSGYFEGAGQRESSEPLQLCVSCTCPDGYINATSLVEELLEHVYSEYRQFCRENGRPEPDLHATPKLVSTSRGERGAIVPNGGGKLAGIGSSPGGNSALNTSTDEPAEDDDDDLPDPGEGLSVKKERLRGRRSRAKRSAPVVERGSPPPLAPAVDEVERLIDARNEARRQCNFAEADKIRGSLHERGVALMDEPGGRGKGSEVTTWRYWRE